MREKLVLYEGHGFRVWVSPWWGLSPHLVVEAYDEEAGAWRLLGTVHPLDLARALAEAEREQALLGEEVRDAA